MKFLPIGILCIAIFLFYLFLGPDCLNFEAVARFQQEVVEGSFFYAIFLFLLAYIVATVTSLPGLFVFDIIAGVLFGGFLAPFIVTIGVVIGSTIVFLSVYYAAESTHKVKRRDLVTKIQEGFNKHATNYLLFLRLVPFFPFGVVTIILGVIKVRPLLFIWTTGVGNFPAAFLYTHIGSGIKHIVQKGGPITTEAVLNGYMITALVGLGVLALIPIFFQAKR